MKFHSIHRSIDGRGNKTKIPVLFQEACEKRDIEFVPYDVCDLGGSFTLSSLPELGKDDLLYRSAVGKNASTAERLMVNDNVTTFYNSLLILNTARIASWFTHVRYGLPVVPSYPGIPSSSDELEMVVEKLGSFPIIIKVTGGSLGVGVMRIDSMNSLRSILDYFSLKRINIMLRQYVPHDFYVRAIVVGDKVVASKAAYVRDGEFRTNTINSEKRRREEKILPEDLQKIVVQAVQTLGMETGGVDLLFDKDGTAYIAEVNFPNDFTTTHRVTGIDIAGKMIEHLIEKNKNKNS